MTDTDGVNMKNWNFKYIAFTLECIILLLVAIMLGISIRKAVRLTKETEVLQEEVKELQAELRKVEKEKAEKETEQVTEESKEVMTELQPTATPIPTATPTEAPTPTPEPMYLEDLTGYVPGDIIDDGQIDPMGIDRYFTSSMIVEGDEVYNRIIGRSYYENDNIQLQNLRYIKLIHRNYEGQTQVGELIVNEAIEADVIDIFTEFYLSGYQVYSMFLIDNFWMGDGDSSDYASIDVNNTSAFCYRTVTGSSTNHMSDLTETVTDHPLTPMHRLTTTIAVLQKCRML